MVLRVWSLLSPKKARRTAAGETVEVTADTGSNEASSGADETIVNVNGEKSEEKVEVRETEAANKEEIESIKAAQAKRSADKEAARLARKKRAAGD